MSSATQTSSESIRRPVEGSGHSGGDARPRSTEAAAVCDRGGSEYRASVGDDVDALKGLYGEYTTVAAYLDSLHLYQTSDNFDAVLDALEAGLRAAHSRVDRLAAAGHHAAELAIDDQCGYIEDLLGAGFVVSQRFLTELISVVLAFGRFVEQSTEGGWRLPRAKVGLLDGYGPRAPTDATISLASLLNASANMFKHQSEWESPWEQCRDRLARPTIELVMRAGVREGSSGKCRTLAEKMGLEDLRNFRPLSDGLAAWAAEVVVAAQSEVDRLGLK